MLKIYFWDNVTIHRKQLTTVELKAPTAQDAADWAETIRSFAPFWEGIFDMPQRKLALLRASIQQGDVAGIGAFGAMAQQQQQAQLPQFGIKDDTPAFRCSTL